jgi:hypothetical protein
MPKEVKVVVSFFLAGYNLLILIKSLFAEAREAMVEMVKQVKKVEKEAEGEMQLFWVMVLTVQMVVRVPMSCNPMLLMVQMVLIVPMVEQAAMEQAQ